MRKIKFRSEHYYHLYNRGINHQCIFFSEENWGFFIKRLREYCTPGIIEMIAYCLMPNHYHFLVHLKHDELSKNIMQPFTVSYTKAINKQQGRTGPLFQGPFKAKLVDKNEYLLHLSRYIHLNPVYAGLVNRAEEWIFSSYRDYIDLRKGSFPKFDIILGQFPSSQTYSNFVESYTESEKKIIEHLMLD